VRASGGPPCRAGRRTTQINAALAKYQEQCIDAGAGQDEKALAYAGGAGDADHESKNRLLHGSDSKTPQCGKFKAKGVPRA